jgi:pyrimidine operon attenuation protein/uracil phosphoribosyltransferase
MLELDAEAIYAELLVRVRAHIAGRSPFLVGVHTGGVWLAERLRTDLGISAPVGILDVSFYRDDHSQGGGPRAVQPSRIPFTVDAADLLLVDDVLYTGRTVRAAMNELFDHGRPARIELAVLVDRGGRELPVHTALVGRTLELPPEVSLVLSRDGQRHLALRLEQPAGAAAGPVSGPAAETA